MSHNRNPKPLHPLQFRQQMVELVAAGRKPSELASWSEISWQRLATMVCRQKRSDVHAIYTPIAANQAELSVPAMCDHLEVSKSGY